MKAPPGAPPTPPPPRHTHTHTQWVCGDSPKPRLPFYRVSKPGSLPAILPLLSFLAPPIHGRATRSPHLTHRNLLLAPPFSPSHSLAGASFLGSRRESSLPLPPAGPSRRHCHADHVPARAGLSPSPSPAAQTAESSRS